MNKEYQAVLKHRTAVKLSNACQSRLNYEAANLMNDAANYLHHGHRSIAIAYANTAINISKNISNDNFVTNNNDEYQFNLEVDAAIKANDEYTVKINYKAINMMNNAIDYLNDDHKYMAVAYAKVAKDISTGIAIMNRFINHIKENDKDDAKGDCKKYKNYLLEYKPYHIMIKALGYLENGYKNTAVDYANTARNLSNNKLITSSFVHCIKENNIDNAGIYCSSYRDYLIDLCRDYANNK